MNLGLLSCVAAHARTQADMTVACIDVPLEDAREFGVMHVDAEGRVVDFVEKPQNPPPMPDQPDRALASMAGPGWTCPGCAGGPI